MRAIRIGIALVGVGLTGWLACKTASSHLGAEPAPRAPASSVQQPPAELGERWSAQDAAASLDVVEANRRQLVQRTGSDAIMKRDAHPKHHGCVMASLRIDAQALPPQDQVGIFAHGGLEFKAWVRFSNGDPDSTKPDTDEDVRGMAVKVMGLPDPNFLSQAGIEPESGVHDFVMMNSPVFFIKNPEEYVDFMNAAGGSALALPWFLLTHPTTLRVLNKARGMDVGNPLQVDYFSATSYRLGPDVMKFEMRSSVPEGQRDKKPSGATPDFLRTRLVNTLQAGGASFDFLVQRASPSPDLPVEEPTRAWDATASPFVKVATLTIPQQTGIASQPQLNFCENVSFNPWRAPLENRPLGQINRVRLDAYGAISALRHEHNHVPQLQPSGFDVCTGATAALCN